MQNAPSKLLNPLKEETNKRFCFGPVPSRRLGRSLGIDILPKKTCNLNCIYCELGEGADLVTIPDEYYPVKEIIQEIDLIIESNVPFDTLTFTASGEPTLHSGLGELISHAKKKTVKPVAVLTNATLFHIEKIRNQLLNADILLPSLDAAREETFRKVNRPAKEVKLTNIVIGLKEIGRVFKGLIWLEVLLVKDINDSDEDIQALKKAIDEINPHKVQLNTIVRPPAVSWAKPVSMEKLEQIKDFIGNNTEIIVDFRPKSINITDNVTSEDVLKVLIRRPMRFYDLEMIFSLDKHKLMSILDKLSEKKNIISRIHNNEVFYFKRGD